jgi:cell division protein FtsA
MGFVKPSGRQVVLTGGGAELKNIADYMQGVLGRASGWAGPRTHRSAGRAQRPLAFGDSWSASPCWQGRAAGETSAISRYDGSHRQAFSGLLARFMAAMRGRN